MIVIKKKPMRSIAATVPGHLLQLFGQRLRGERAMADGLGFLGWGRGGGT